MDKEKAFKYVINRLMKGYDRNTIITELSGELQAPIELVSKFVDKVSESYTTSQNLDDPQSTKFQTDNRDKKTTEFANKNGEYRENEKTINIGIQSRLHANKEISPVEEPADSELIDDYNQPNRFGQNRDIDVEAINRFVIKSIKNHHRHNDIVAAVCSMTKMDWNEAQRLVAKIQTQSFEELSTSNRTTAIWFSMAFIFGGILLLGWSLSGVVDIIKTITGMQPSNLPSEFLIWQMGGFVISLGIIAGGIFGIYQSLSNQ
jgi:hypothetical protein